MVILKNRFQIKQQHAYAAAEKLKTKKIFAIRPACRDHRCHTVIYNLINR